MFPGFHGHTPISHWSRRVSERTVCNIYPSNNLQDLLDDTPFTRADIIHLQDPQNLQKFNLSTYYHVKNNLKANQSNADKNDSRRNLKHISNETRSVLDQHDKEYKVMRRAQLLRLTDPSPIQYGAE